MMQGVIDKLHARFVDAVYSNRKSILTKDEVRALADGRILTADEALEARLIDRVSYLDETISTMKTSLNLAQAQVVTYERPKTFKSNIYSETAGAVPQSINLLSINAEDFSLFSGTQFMYLWNP